jgi:hypothetical protein
VRSPQRQPAAENRTPCEESGLRVLHGGLEVPPGRYQIRVAANQTGQVPPAPSSTTSMCRIFGVTLGVSRFSPHVTPAAGRDGDSRRRPPHRDAGSAGAVRTFTHRRRRHRSRSRLRQSRDAGSLIHDRGRSPHRAATSLRRVPAMQAPDSDGPLHGINPMEGIAPGKYGW